MFKKYTRQEVSSLALYINDKYFLLYNGACSRRYLTANLNTVLWIAVDFNRPNNSRQIRDGRYSMKNHNADWLALIGRLKKRTSWSYLSQKIKLSKHPSKGNYLFSSNLPTLPNTFIGSGALRQSSKQEMLSFHRTSSGYTLHTRSWQSTM